MIRPSGPENSTSIFPNFMIVSTHPALQEGRFAIVTDVGSGMRWTLWLRKTSATGADGEVVWS